MMRPLFVVTCTSGESSSYSTSSVVYSVTLESISEDEDEDDDGDGDASADVATGWPKLEAIDDRVMTQRRVSWIICGHFACVALIVQEDVLSIALTAI